MSGEAKFASLNSGWLLGNGTQSIVMGLNETSHAEDLLIAGGKPLPPMTAEEEKRGRRRRNWKGFYGSVHDIVSLTCVTTGDALFRQELRSKLDSLSGVTLAR